MKMAIARRFENRTDTFETWDMLQQDCLLVRYESQEQERKESGLGRRLRQARETQQVPPPEPTLPLGDTAHRLVTPLPVIPTKPKREAPTPRADATGVSPAREGQYGIALSTSQRVLRLPDQGDIVFGRFEHGFSNPPDIDLALDDGEIPSVSRRHATILCRGGRHWIEDMGSINGTYVNGHQLPLGKSAQLSEGDRILLGRCRLIYAPLPDWMSQPDPRQPHVASLLVTRTGYRIELPEKSPLVLGRPDPTLGYEPDVDLSVAGDIAMYISRRHAQIITQSGWHFLEEVGSAAGTKLNGQLIQLGAPPVMLRPGDQLWLGGCVLAYEWTLL